MTSSRFCRECDDELVLSVNWKHCSKSARTYWCNTCLVLRGKERYAKDREHINKRIRERSAATMAWVRAIKMDSGCVDCGYKDHPSALDFDHTCDDKLFDIGSGASLSREKLQREIDKCDVVCANCHRIRTYNRRKEESS